MSTHTGRLDIFEDGTWTFIERTPSRPDLSGPTVIDLGNLTKFGDLAAVEARAAISDDRDLCRQKLAVEPP